MHASAQTQPNTKCSHASIGLISPNVFQPALAQNQINTKCLLTIVVIATDHVASPRQVINNGSMTIGFVQLRMQSCFM